MANIPVGPVIIEGIASVFMFITLWSTILKYRERKIREVLLLLLSFGFTFIGIFNDFIGRLLVYSLNWNAKYTHPFAVIDFIFVLLGVLIMFYFSDLVFEFNKGTNLLRLFSALTGLTIGVELYNLIYYPIYDYGTQPAKIYFIASVFYAITVGGMYIIIFLFGIRRAKVQQDRIKRIGTRIIASYGLWALITVVMMAIDAIVSESFSEYKLTYYIAWVMIILAIIGAYTGYFMPEWFKKLLSKFLKEEKTNKEDTTK